MRLSDAELRWMQTRMMQRYDVISDELQAKLERQFAALAPDAALLTRWCYAASPLSDWANYDFALFQSYAEHALLLRERLRLLRGLCSLRAQLR